MSCSKYNAGMLRTAVTFERAVKTSDGAGGYSEAWSELLGAPVRGYIKQLSSREQYASERIEGRVKLRLTVRYNALLAETDRVLIRGKRYNIEGINNVEFRNSWLEIDLAGGVAT